MPCSTALNPCTTRSRDCTFRFRFRFRFGSVRCSIGTQAPACPCVVSLQVKMFCGLRPPQCLSTSHLPRLRLQRSGPVRPHRPHCRPGSPCPQRSGSNCSRMSTGKSPPPPFPCHLLAPMCGFPRARFVPPPHKRARLAGVAFMARSLRKRLLCARPHSIPAGMQPYTILVVDDRCVSFRTGRDDQVRWRRP
jgi:hypothetical protein